MNLSIFTVVFLKNRNFTSKIKRSKVTDYAAIMDFSRPLSNFPALFKADLIFKYYSSLCEPLVNEKFIIASFIKYYQILYGLVKILLLFLKQY